MHRPAPRAAQPQPPHAHPAVSSFPAVPAPRDSAESTRPGFPPALVRGPAYLDDPDDLAGELLDRPEPSEPTIVHDGVAGLVVFVLLVVGLLVFVVWVLPYLLV